MSGENREMQINLIIEDHFDVIKNQLDIHIGEAIAEMSDKREIEKINQIHNHLLLEIEIIKKFNLTFNPSLHAQLLDKYWGKLAKNKSIKNSSKLESIKKDFIKKDCVLMTDSMRKSELSMWVFDSYSNNLEHVAFFKNFDEMGNPRKSKDNSFITIGSLDKALIKIICILNSKNKSSGVIKDYSDFDMSSIKILDFQRVPLKIGLIKNCAFSQLAESLEELNMVFETIDETDYSTFKYLTNLKKLTLKCRIKTQLFRIHFQDLLSLKELSLDGFILNTSVVKNLTNLTRLTLKNSSISRIDSDLFENLTQLEYLNLDENQIRKIDSGSFRNLTNLRFLSLENNSISTINCLLLRNLINLQYLSLKSNQLSYFPNGIFDNLSSLVFLNLEYNHLTFLDVRTFSKLTNLLYLQTSLNEGIENVRV